MAEGSRRILRNSVWLLSGDVLGRLLGAAYQILLARTLGTALFGEFTFAMAVAAILAMLSDLGLSNLTVREVARTRDRPWNIVSGALRARAALALVLGVIAVAVSSGTGQPSRATALLAILLATGLVQGQAEVLTAAHRGREEVAFPVALAFACRLGLVLSGVAAILLGASVIHLAALTTLWALPLPAALALGLPGRTESRPSPDTTALRMLGRALPIGLGAALWAFYFRVDMVVLGRLMGDDAVGRYGAAFRLVEAVLLLQGPLLAATVPLLSRRGPEHEEHREAFHLLVRGLAFVSMPLAVLFFVEGREVMTALFGEPYAQAGSSLALLGLVIPLSALAAPFLTLLICRDMERRYTVIMAAGALLNPLLDVLLIPAHGIAGAAVATLVTELAVMALALRAASSLAVPSRLPELVARALAAALVFGGVLFLAGCLRIPFPVRAGVGILVAYPIIALAVRAVRGRDLRLVLSALRSPGRS